jgi:hypothetical protein
MDRKQYSTLLQALRHVPDPRHARGKRHDWTFILGVITGAVLHQQRSAAAIAQWAQAHAEALVTAFHPQHQRVPSEATIRRALHHVNVRALETHLARLQNRPAHAPAHAPTCRMKGYAVDGKYVRGAGAWSAHALGEPGTP